MLEVLAFATIALSSANVLFVVVLIARRVYLGRRLRESALLEARALPLAHRLVDTGMLEGTLSADEQVALARVLARMSRLLKGDARANIGQYFEQGAAYRKELAALGSRRAWRRAAAAFALGDMAVDAAEPYLLGALEDPHRDVRAAAARSLGRIGSPQAVEPLVRRLANGTLPRIVAGSALLAIGDQALPRLRVLLELPDPDVRATAAELIGLLGSASDADALEPWLNDAHPAVRAQAATALGRVGARRGAEGLLAALEDEDPDVRVSAARALGAVRERAAVPALLRHARDDEFAAAHAAAAAAYATDPAAVAAVADPGPQLLEVLDLAAL